MIGDRVICLRFFGGLLLNARSEKCSQMLSPKYFPHSFCPRKHLLSDPLAAADNLFHFHSAAYQQTCANLLPEGRWNRLRKHNKHCVVKKFVPFSENTFWCPQGVVFLRWSLFYHSKALFFSVKTIFSATKSDSTAPKKFFATVSMKTAFEDNTFVCHYFCLCQHPSASKQTLCCFKTTWPIASLLSLITDRQWCHQSLCFLPMCHGDNDNVPRRT